MSKEFEYARDERLRAAAPAMYEAILYADIKISGWFAMLNHGIEPSELMTEQARDALDKLKAVLALAEGRS